MEIMRLSQQYAPTLKEDPADAEIASHRLLVRAGMIRNCLLYTSDAAVGHACSY